MKRLTTIALIGLEALVLSACQEEPNKTTIQDVEHKENQQIIDQHQQELRQNLADPFDGFKYLGEGEYVVPEKVLETIHNVYYQSIEKGFNLGGLWLKQSLSSGNLKIFNQELEFLDITQKEKKAYFLTFSQPEIIVYSHRIFLNRHFRKTIFHERSHRYMENQMKEKEHFFLKRAYYDLMTKSYPITKEGIKEAEKDGFSFLRIEEAKEKKKSCEASQILYCNHLKIRFINLKQEIKFTRHSTTIVSLPKTAFEYNEFFAYFIEERMSARVETILKRDHQEAYKIIEKIKKDIKLF